MKRQFVNYQDSLFIITILFFVLGIVNISFSILGLLCMMIPFILYFIYKDKIWCKYYCPRAGLFLKILSKISLRKKLPKVLKSNNLKKGVVIYFVFNLIVIIISTIKVYSGIILPVEHVGFLFLFKVPISLPQLIDFTMSSWLIHLGYRIYSMIFTTTVIGIVLGILYTPRTWCVICPVQTLTSINKKKKSN
jgi:polyferredoxin